MQSEKSMLTRFPPAFAQASRGPLNVTLAVIARGNRRQMANLTDAFSPVCTKSGHMLVDELHSIDFTRDKVASFLLTQKSEGVKP